jgi:hypothetical protein
MRATINFYLTWKCNFTCAHCIHECGPQGNHMTESQIDYAFDFVRWLMDQNVGIAVVGTTGGEATLHPLFWTGYMPRLAALKNLLKAEIFELHSNASVPVPEIMKQAYPRFFNTLFIGHDMCHRMFKPLNELYIQDYSEVVNNICLRQNDYIVGGMHTIFIRAKGRAHESLMNGTFEMLPVQGHPKMNCSWHDEQRGMDCLHFTFTPDHINHCGEKSHPLPPLPNNQGKIDEGQFWEYGMDFNKLMHAALDYNTKYSGPNCSQKCMTSFCRKTIKPTTTISLVEEPKKNELSRIS